MKQQNSSRASLPAVSVGRSENRPFGLRDIRFEESGLTWEHALRTLRKNRRFVLLLGGGLALTVVVVALLLPNVYQPTARLEIAPPTTGIKTLHEIESNTEAENQDYLETQAQILRSDALAVGVIRELHLDTDPEFVSARRSKALATSVVADRQAQLPDNPYLQEQLELATLTPREAATLEKFRKNISVGTVRNTRLIEVSYTGHDPRLARRITNTLVSKFIDQSYRHRYTTTMQASEWLSSRLGDLRRKVEDSNQAVANYQQKFGLVEMDDRDVPLSQFMGETNHQLSEAQATRIESEAYVRMIDLGQADSIPALRDDQVYQNLMTRYADTRAQLAQAKAVYGDANTNVKKLEDQSTELATQMDAERERVSNRVRTSYTAAKERERIMLRARESLRSQMGSASSHLVGYRMLKSEAIANAELYNTLQARLKEAGIYAGLHASNIRVVDLATNLQKASGPHRGLLIAGGTLASALLAIFVCFLKESFDNTVRTPDDIKSWIGLPSLAILPAVTKGETSAESHVLEVGRWPDFWRKPQKATNPRNISIMKALTTEAEAMRDLRTTLLFPRSGDTPRVFLISSSTEGEGKTTVAVNFAIALAQIGRTCLLDADLRQPMVAKALGLEPKSGLADVLLGTARSEIALIPVPAIPNLETITSGHSADNPADVLSSSRMGLLCEDLKKSFDFIVIDSPPVIGFSDARYLSRHADEVILVSRYGVTSRRAIQRSAELLQDVHAPVAGVVLNAIDLSSPDYHYFTYGYSRGELRRAAEYAERIPPDSAAADDQTPKARGAHA